MQAGRSGDAVRLSTQVLGASAPDTRPWQDALLVIGLAQRQEGDPAADATLRSFLRSAPHHPAAPAVRRLLGGS